MDAMLDPTCQARQEMDPSLPADFGDGICQTLLPYFDLAASNACQLTSQIPQEEVGIDKPIPSLPGCNRPWAGPGLPSSKPTCNPAPATPLIGNPSKIFTWDNVPQAHIDPAAAVPVYDGFNPAPIPAPAPSGPASGTMFLTTGANWGGTSQTWPWNNGVCKTLVSPL